MRITSALAALTLAGGLASAALAQTAAPAPAGNPKCKDAVTAKARSSAQVSDATREQRARDKAISNWKKRARDTYGWRYSFWRSAEEKNVQCGGGASAKHCTVTAKPCRVL